MALTERQVKVLKSQVMTELKSIRVDLHYSIKALADYRDDLQSEAKELTKALKKARYKLNQVEDKILAAGGKLHKLK